MSTNWPAMFDSFLRSFVALLPRRSCECADPQRATNLKSCSQRFFPCPARKLDHLVEAPIPYMFRSSSYPPFLNPNLHPLILCSLACRRCNTTTNVPGCLTRGNSSLGNVRCQLFSKSCPSPLCGCHKDGCSINQSLWKPGPLVDRPGQSSS